MSSFSQVLKKHRHRIGLAYFAAGALFGIVVCNFFPSKPVASTSSLKGGVEGKSGWKNIHVFYGDSKHIKDNSAVPNDYYDRVRWFSQARQDEVIAALLRNKTNGYFVDLASNDPVRISNTYALEKFYGWKGLCLEPNPVYWAGLSYRQCDVVGAVVGGERMQEIWFKFPNRAGPQGGIVGKGFDNKLSSKFDEDRPRYTVTLLEIFQQFKTPSVIDYLSLDVGKNNVCSRFIQYGKSLTINISRGCRGPGDE